MMISLSMSDIEALCRLAVFDERDARSQAAVLLSAAIKRATAKLERQLERERQLKRQRQQAAAVEAGNAASAA